MNQKFVDCLDELDIKVTDRMLEQFDLYYRLLTDWNKVMNLTAITEYNEVFLKHFADSLYFVKAADPRHFSKLIDVGTGAGFPGIPIKIVFPEIQVTLLDSLNKRIKFLNTVIDQLGLRYITAVHGRAEDLARKKEHREQYDACLSRAVANLSTLSEYCLPFTKVGGYFFSYKSGEIEDEVSAAQNAVSLLGGKICETQRFNLMDTDIKRSIIVIKKVKETKNKYPRKAGTPAKEPLH